MRVIILIFFSFFGFQSIGQNKIDSYIQKIDNSQFHIAHGSAATFSINSPAAFKLIKKGKATTAKLIKALDDSTKIIMAHLILCHVYFKHVSFAGPKTVSTANETINKYYLGEEKGEGLIISEIGNRKFIEFKDLGKIKIYWKEKVKH